MISPRAMLRWGASGALYLQSAIAGLKGHLRFSLVGKQREKGAMMVRSYTLRELQTPPGPKGSNGKKSLLGAVVNLIGAYLSLCTCKAKTRVEA